MKVVYKKLPHPHYESKIPLKTGMDLNIKNKTKDCARLFTVFKRNKIS